MRFIFIFLVFGFLLLWLYFEINGDGVEMESHIPEHPVYGDDKPLNKGKI